LSGLILALAFIPPPAAWATSVMWLPYVQIGRQWIIHNIDVLTVAAVMIASIEPALLRLLALARLVIYAPRLLYLLVGLVWVYLQIGYWRYRNRRLRLLAG
jgi:hypothetical protein